MTGASTQATCSLALAACNHKLTDGNGVDQAIDMMTISRLRSRRRVMKALLLYWIKLVLFVVLSSPQIAQGSLWGQPTTKFRAGATMEHEGAIKEAGRKQGLAVGVVVLNGSAESGQNETLSDSSLPWIRDLSSTTATPACSACFLFDPSKSTSVPFLKIGNLPNENTILPESLGILCDIVVVVLMNGDGLTDFLPALIKGAERRVDQSLTKGNLIFVSPTGTNDTWWKDRIAQQEGRQISPRVFGQFEIVTVEELGGLWEQYVEEATTSQSMPSMASDQDLFPTLLHQVYRSLGGKSTIESDETSLRYFHPVNFNMTDKPSQRPIAPERPRRVRRHVEHDHHLVVQDVLTVAQRRLEELETRMDEVWLDQEKHPMPLLDFGDKANEILNDAYDGLQPPLPEALRMEISLSVASQIRQLYKKQLDALRNYYGKRYETVLQEETSKNGNGETREDYWQEAAAGITESFRAAAQHAVPTMCQVGGTLRDADFEYVSSLQGLISDMMEATQLKQDEKSLSMEDVGDDDNGATDSPSRRRMPRWCKKVLSRALSLGINYLQGWLAWQGIKRAAIERDKHMPKFPLY